MGEDLKHYGVKGMKWGVRKARTGDLHVRAKRNERVAAGKGSFVDKAVTLGGSSVGNLVVNRGLKGEAARRAADKRGQIERLSTGKAKASDVLRAYGGLSVSSLLISAHKKSDFDIRDRGA